LQPRLNDRSQLGFQGGERLAFVQETDAQTKKGGPRRPPPLQQRRMIST
jgi:hypothetical protein